ncbi:MAG: hypothetical protein ACHQD9_08985 [Chitinophagales bacterium]
MKSNILIVLFFAGIAGLISCTKNNNSSVSQNINSNQLKQGSWKVTNFWDKDHDETNSFDGVGFTFNSAGSVSAVSGGSTVGGNWSIGMDDTQSKLTLQFTTTPFSDINDDWHIVDLSSTVMHLADVSGGNGTTEMLTLEKI